MRFIRIQKASTSIIHFGRREKKNRNGCTSYFFVYFHPANFQNFYSTLNASEKKVSISGRFFVIFRKNAFYSFISPNITLVRLEKISKFSSNVFKMDLIKHYESYTNKEGLNFNLKLREAHLLYEIPSNEITENSEYFASVTKLPDAVLYVNRYKAMIFARHLINDKKIRSLIGYDPSIFLKSNLRTKKNSSIIIPRPIKTYKSKTRLMGINLRSTRCVVCISRNGRTETVKIDQEYAIPISFAEKNPIVGSAALRKLRQESDSVVFDFKRISLMEWRFGWLFGIYKTLENLSFIVYVQKKKKEYSMNEIQISMKC